jgi:glutamine amidotransferase
MKKKIAIVDYGLGNLFSVKQAFDLYNIDSVITSNPNEIINSNILVLPGVGSFPEAMKNLKQNNLTETLKEFAKSGKPFIGICLGMQLMFTKSEEFGKTNGLGLIKGVVKRFESKSKTKTYSIPQIQWNKIFIEKSTNNNHFFKFINNGSYMYFVHSFYCIPKNSKNIVCSTKYAGTKYPSIVQKDNCIGIQFHPEKSGEGGLKIYHEISKLL